MTASSPKLFASSLDARRVFFLAVAAAAVLFAVARVWAMRWLHDDAFVTFRYVDNFWRGWGLVWNRGERVEGFTHPLWMGLLLAARGLGGDPLPWSQILGTASVAGTMACAGALSWRISDAWRVCFPFTAAALALHYDFIVWGTSGLETAFFGFLLILAFTLYFYTAWSRDIKLLAAGFLLTAAMATRPDGVLFCAMALGLLAVRAWHQRLPWRRAGIEVALFTLPALLLFLPWMAWKTSYYGSLLPNTYYVKSGGGQQWGYGLHYLWTFFRIYPFEALFVLGIPAAAWLIHGQRRVTDSGSGAPPSEVEAAGRDLAPVLTALAGVILYIVLFIARVGGDYMFARMMMPLLPFMYWIAEWALRRSLAHRPAAVLALTTLLPLVILAENHRRMAQVAPREETAEAFFKMLDVQYITDEHWFYTTRFYSNGRNNIETQEYLGLTLGSAFEGLDVVFLIGAANATAYFSRLPVVIEKYGLTDTVISRMPPDESARPGHQKLPSLEYLRERGVDFYFMPNKGLEGYTPEFYQKAFLRRDEMFPLTLFTYDAALIAAIRQREGERFLITDFPAWLDDYTANTMPGLPPGRVAADLEKFRLYYFNYNDDPAREGTITEWLNEHDNSGDKR